MGDFEISTGKRFSKFFKKELREIEEETIFLLTFKTLLRYEKNNEYLRLDCRYSDCSRSYIQN